MHASRTALLCIAAFLAGCTDGATRIATDIQSRAEKLQKTDSRTYDVLHVPEKEPDGCGDAYRVQFSKESVLVIWCKDSETGQVTSSHATTYHLNFVKVPKTYLLDKKAGDPLVIELTKTNREIAITDVR